jgi:hypothetical protein
MLYEAKVSQNSIRYLAHIVFFVLVVTWSSLVGAVPVSINFEGKVVALDSKSPSGNYSLDNYVIGPCFTGSLSYDLDPFLSIFNGETYLYPALIEVNFTSGQSAATNTFGEGPSLYKPSLVIDERDSLSINSDSIYFNGNPLVLSDPWARITFNKNTMDGNLIFGFTDFSGGSLTCAINHFTQDSLPVPEPSTSILLAVGFMVILVLMARKQLPVLKP